MCVYVCFTLDVTIITLPSKVKVSFNFFPALADGVDKPICFQICLNLGWYECLTLQYFLVVFHYFVNKRCRKWYFFFFIPVNICLGLPCWIGPKRRETSISPGSIGKPIVSPRFWIDAVVLVFPLASTRDPNHVFPTVRVKIIDTIARSLFCFSKFSMVILQGFIWSL